MQFYAELGNCSTCGRLVTTHFDIDTTFQIEMQQNGFVEIDGHCGQGGHAYRVMRLTEEEYKTAIADANKKGTSTILFR